MQSQVYVAFSLLIGFALAGCVGADEAPAPEPLVAEEPEVTQESGSISGLVTTDEGMPIAGVTAAVLELDRQTQTDSAGAFTINNVTGGKYSLIVEKLGFDTQARSVQVVPGEVTPVDFTLNVVVLSPDPIAALTIEEGFIQCSYNPYWPTNVCGEHLGSDHAKIPFSIDGNLSFQEIIIELDWVPNTAATGQELEMDICDRRPASDDNTLLCFNYEHYWAFASGSPPVVLRLNDLPLEDTLNYEVDVGSGFMSPYPAIQQDFTLYITLCYYEDCDGDYTAIPPS